MLVFEVMANCVYPQIAADVLTTEQWMDMTTKCALITQMCVLGENL